MTSEEIVDRVALFTFSQIILVWELEPLSTG